MSQFAQWGTWPLEWGGGPSSAETVYDALRKALGGPDGGELGPVDGTDDLRIQALALTIDAVASMYESAVYQAFPEHASYLLDVLIEEFGLDAEGDDELSRLSIFESETEEQPADAARLALALAELDPKLSVLAYDENVGRQTIAGRSLVPRGYTGTAGAADKLGTIETAKSSALPMFSDRDVVWLRYTLAPLELTIPAYTIRAVRALFSREMPAWVDFSLTVPGVFYCDGGVDNTSLLDQTPMG